MSKDDRTDRSGFTLIELIAVIAILAVLSALSIPRFVEVDASAAKQAMRSAVVELNNRESLTWNHVKLSTTGWVGDADLFSQVNTDLGPDFKWTPNASDDGGNLHFKEHMLKLERESSLATCPATWAEKK